MSKPRLAISALLCSLAILSGCFPNKPMYLRDQGDLSYYLDQASDVEYPDVQTPRLEEVSHARPPITITDSDFNGYRELTLEEAVSSALHNNTVLRGYGTPGLQNNRVAPGIDILANGPAGAGTVYNVAIRQTEPGFIRTPGQITPPGTLTSNTGLDANQGVEAALSEFDAQYTASLFWDRSDSPRNTTTSPFDARVFQQDSVQFLSELSKRTATGTQLFARHRASYTDNNIPLESAGGFQTLRSIYQTALELEVRQPLLRGRGAFINRMPVVISRIGADQEIANLEAQLQNVVTNVEIRYWDLYCAYRNLKAAIYGRDSALATWKIVNDKYLLGTVPAQQEAQAREQYFFFRGQAEQAEADLLTAEGDLRWVMGWATTDGDVIRPIDEPVKAPIEFDWCQSLDEALTFRPELRQERWEVRKRQLALAYAKNSLLPNLNAVAEYSWQGFGDRLISYDNNTPDYPSPNSGAWNDLMGGDYQEFRFGLEYGMPIGFRAEKSNVRNAQLKLAREIAYIQDMELDVARQLSEALRALKTNYQLAQTNFNRWMAASVEVDSARQRFEQGKDTLDLVLEAQERRSRAEVAYYQSLCEYNKVIAMIHRRKGTTLAYSNIAYEEGPWPGKAYDDARENARRRSASREINYGWTRPEVISQGPIDPPNCSDCGDGYLGDGVIDQSSEFQIEGEYYEDVPELIETPQPSPATPNPDMTPGGQTPQGTPPGQGDRGARLDRSVQPSGYDRPVASTLSDQFHASNAPVQRAGAVNREVISNQTGPRKKNVRQVNWAKLGLTPPETGNRKTEAIIRQVNHQQ